MLEESRKCFIRLVLCYFDSCQDQISSVCLQYVFNQTILEFSRILFNNSNQWNYFGYFLKHELKGVLKYIGVKICTSHRPWPIP
jgi:hypothetical protein